MKMKTLHSHPVIGEITVNRSPRARRISVSVRTSGVTLTLPTGYPLADALGFVESRKAWIERARQRVSTRKSLPALLLPPFRTRLHDLVLECGEKPGARIGGGVIRVRLASGWAPEEDQAQAWIKKAVVEAFRIEAKTLLPARIEALATQNGFVYNELTFRDTVSRWGSCSGRNAISLSIRLMLLPDPLIDYVILHELCHTRQKNHGPKFHALLERLTEGRHRQYEKELKNYTPRW
jgi:predicted metal-dependent hydrolase